MIAKKIKAALSLDAEHILYFHLGTWYNHLKKFPGILVDKNGYVRIESEVSYSNHEYLKHGPEHIHIQNGICSLSGYIEFTEEQKYIVNQFSDEKEDVTEFAERKPRNIDSILRDPSLVRLIKRLRNNTCQICNSQLKIGPKSFYSEVHHIRPLGMPHNGPDILANMICVCPNCHKKLDYGFERIEIDRLEHLPRHTIGKFFVDYHNARV